jgi:hypothetical protein
MMEETKTGFVLWAKVVPDRLLFMLGERDESSRFKVVELDPTIFSLSRSHPMFSTAESMVHTSLIHDLRIAVTADGGAVSAVALSTRILHPFETPADQRRRTAEGPTPEWADALAGRIVGEAERQAEMAQAEAEALRNLRLAHLFRQRLIPPEEP